MIARSCPVSLPVISTWAGDSPVSPISSSQLQQAVYASPRLAYFPCSYRSDACAPSPKTWISKSSRDRNGLRQSSLPVPSHGHAPRLPSKQHSMPAGAGLLKASSGKLARASPACSHQNPYEEHSSAESYTFVLSGAPFDRLLQVANESSKQGAVVSIQAAMSSVVVQPGYSGSLDACIDAVEGFLERMDWMKARSDGDSDQRKISWYAYEDENKDGRAGPGMGGAEEEEDAWQAPHYHYTVSP